MRSRWRSVPCSACGCRGDNPLAVEQLPSGGTLSPTADMRTHFPAGVRARCGGVPFGGPGWRRRKLLCLDARRLDDRPPFLDLGLVEGSQPLRHLLVAWHNLITQVYKPLAGRRIGQSLHDRRVELADDPVRRAFWNPNRTPNRTVEPGQSRLIYRRDIRSQDQAAPAGERVGFDVAGTHLRQ